MNRAIERFAGDGSAHARPSWRDQIEITADRPWLGSYGKHTPCTFPIPRQQSDAFMEGSADWFPNHNAIIFYGSSLTYKQLDRKVNQFAHALRRMGVKPGDRVMIVLPNVPQMVIAYCAVLKICADVVLPNPDADGE